MTSDSEGGSPYGSIGDSVEKQSAGQGGAGATSGGVGSGTSTPYSSGTSDAPYKSTPNSIYEKIGNDNTVASRAFYDNHGNQFCRQDFNTDGHYDRATHQECGSNHQHNYGYNDKGQKNYEGAEPMPDGYNDKPSVNKNNALSQ